MLWDGERGGGTGGGEGKRGRRGRRQHVDQRLVEVVGSTVWPAVVGLLTVGVPGAGGGGGSDGGGGG